LEDTTRHRFLVDNPPLRASGWLPPAAEVPELAHLRSDHDRLLDAVAETQAVFGDVRRRRDDELEARRAGQERAFLGGETEVPPEVTTSEAEVAEAAERTLVARDALQAFTRSAITEVGRLEPTLLAQLKEVVDAANEKRALAARIAAEAEAMEASTRKLSVWLARATGRSPLGQISYEDLIAPGPSATDRMTVAELYEAASPGFGVAELDGPFGTDHPENLDDDARPWAVDLPEEANANA
jgi:hypothetical protein